MTDNGYSYESFIFYLNYATSNGLISHYTAKGQRYAVKRVLSTYSPEALQDLRKLNVKDACEKFANEQCDNVNTKAKQVYLSRFRSSMRSFFAYKKNNSTPSSLIEKDNESTPPNKELEKKVATKAPPSEKADMHVEDTISLNFPLGNNQFIQILGIPLTLTKKKADKLCDLIQTIPEKE
ncbi:hypothetical protein ONV78_17750 [Hahella sp. CR1]|uniref:hypothetical protein n=1 Tax=Hahella sp. CR1 TaxID=2992807 RepID=UPI0024428CA6|nr:hypothetical protein [Hahella sp. CR1]MDG9669586.1 hypothetical protein [Hahella sp. CR1]